MPKKGWTQREGKRFIFEVGLICNIVSLVCLFIAFVTPYWIISWPRVFSQFKRIGLWEVCFAGYVLEMDPTEKSYHGCWWILAPEFWNIRSILMPSWFVWTQVAVTLCFVAEMVQFGMMAIIWIRTGMTQRDHKTKRKRDPFVLIHVACIITLSTVIIMTITLVMFAIKFQMARHWLPNQQFNYLSWSYGLALVSTFSSIGALIAQFVYVSIVRQQTREPPTSDPMAVSGFSGSSNPLNKTAPPYKSKESLSRSKENLPTLYPGGESDA